MAAVYGPRPGRRRGSDHRSRSHRRRPIMRSAKSSAVGVSPHSSRRRACSSRSGRRAGTFRIRAKTSVGTSSSRHNSVGRPSRPVVTDSHLRRHSVRRAGEEPPANAGPAAQWVAFFPRLCEIPPSQSQCSARVNAALSGCYARHHNLERHPQIVTRINWSPGAGVRARTTPCTSDAPARRSARAAAEKVAPVVTTSSTNHTRALYVVLPRNDGPSRAGRQDPARLRDVDTRRSTGDTDTSRDVPLRAINSA